MKLIINDSTAKSICEEVTKIICAVKTNRKCTLLQAVNELVTWFKDKIRQLLILKDGAVNKHYYMLMVLNQIQVSFNKAK